MAFLFGESFNNFAAATTAQLQRAFTSINAFTTTAFIAGRFSGNALDLRGATGSLLFTSLGGAKTTLIQGVAYKRTAPFFAGRIFAFRDGAIIHVDITMGTDGRISAFRGATLLGTTAFSLPVGVWVGLQAKVFISDTVGTVEIRLNGSPTPILLLTGIDTRNGGNASVDAAVLGPSTSGESGAYDDYWICDDTIVDAANPLNDFLGDLTWKSQYPTAPGVTTDFGVVGAASNFDAVNDAIPTDDAKYVFADTVAKRDTYECSDLPLTDTIKLVNLSYLARKTDAGAATLKPVVISGATTDVPATGKPVLDSYTYIKQHKPLDPNTGLPWAPVDFNAAKFGEEFAVV